MATAPPSFLAMLLSRLEVTVIGKIGRPDKAIFRT